MDLTEAQRRRQARARAGWEPPGPMPPGDGGDPSLRPAEGETLDAFAGHWRIFQLRRGHRYSTDDLLAAWCAVDTLERLGRIPARALDLGTGVGSVALFLAWAWPRLQVTGVELQAASLALARRSARYNGAWERTRWVGGDLRGLTPDAPFELVTGSPPYWDPARGVVSGGPQKGAARFELTGEVEDYAQAAARCLRADGVFALVYDGRQLDRLGQALASAGLRPIRLEAVISREGDAPLLAIAAAVPEGCACAPALPPPCAPLVLRHRDGRRTEAFRALRARMGLPPGPR